MTTSLITGIKGAKQILSQLFPPPEDIEKHLDRFLAEDIVNQIRSSKEGHLSQAEYFALLQGMLYTSGYSGNIIYFYGYDKAFMEREGTINALERACERGIIFQFVFPQTFSSLLNNSFGKYGIIRSIQEETDRGCILFEYDWLAVWDSNRPTTYDAEINTYNPATHTGIFRALYFIKPLGLGSIIGQAIIRKGYRKREITQLLKEL